MGVAFPLFAIQATYAVVAKVAQSRGVNIDASAMPWGGIWRTHEIAATSLLSVASLCAAISFSPRNSNSFVAWWGKTVMKFSQWMYRRRRLILFSGTVTVFGTVLVCQTINSMDIVATPERIVCEFGNTSMANFEVVLTNTTEQTFRIVEVRSSCSCVRGVIIDSELQGHDKVSLMVFVDKVLAKPGMNYLLYVKTTSRRTPFVAIAVTTNVK